MNWNRRTRWWAGGSLATVAALALVLVVALRPDEAPGRTVTEVAGPQPSVPSGTRSPGPSVSPSVSPSSTTSSAPTPTSSPEPTGVEGPRRPANEPPVITDAGLSSDGMLLRIAPAVSDPDGDEVALMFEVDGVTVEPAANDPTSAVIRLDPVEVGYRYTAPVSITATDAEGAVARVEATHEVAARSTVSILPVELRVSNPEACYRGDGSRGVRILRRVGGAIQSDDRVTGRMVGSTWLSLLRRRTATVVGRDPAVNLRIVLAIGSYEDWLDFPGVNGPGEWTPEIGACKLRVRYAAEVRTR